MSERLLTLDAVSRRFGRRGAQALDRVTLALSAGETLGVVGESGSGKSTLALVAAGLSRPDAGRVHYRGQRMGMVFQDPAASLDPLWRVGESIAEPLRALSPSLPAAEVGGRVVALLEQVGLSRADAGRYPATLSGGQRQRVSIARALAARPELLICDEPTSALDASVQAQVLTLLRSLQERHGFAMLFISHNLAVVRYMAGTIAVMLLGRVVESGPAGAVLGAPLHPYTRLLVSAVPDPAAIGVVPALPEGDPPSPLDPPSGCAFHPRCPFAISRCRIERPALSVHGGRDVACHRAEALSSTPTTREGIPVDSERPVA